MRELHIQRVSKIYGDFSKFWLLIKMIKSVHPMAHYFPVACNSEIKQHAVYFNFKQRLARCKLLFTTSTYEMDFQLTFQEFGNKLYAY